MKKLLYEPGMIGSVLGIIGSLIYILILTAGGYSHTSLAGFISLLSVIIGYYLLSTFWLPALLESKETVALSTGIAFHTTASFSLVFMMAGSLPEVRELIIPYISTLLFSLLMISLLTISGLVLSKLEFNRTNSQSETKVSI
ncbi:hypothetical protein [Pseudalkalibacillus hwajinpoensis]|uniref:Uncharacterized protein n=1 Tax=Guptibacillus hwajinpoensis TaxID=208199 RepID=A0A4U1MJC9_9BACL|nr:hypothetical protein [Pseudalkalibacillus hwajinpoensis]TKD70582.1 hypothetical protein FBF83_08085 [Pseudalkalibacillus hwajinpoensis]